MRRCALVAARRGAACEQRRRSRRAERPCRRRSASRARYGNGPYHPLLRGPGEPYRLRTELAPASRRRLRTRRSLAFFGQLTDPQIADRDVTGAGRAARPAGGAVAASWRPQEALGVHVLDATVRALNAARTSSVEQGDGRRARLGFAIATGDLPDNTQVNETPLVRLGARRGPVDPYSGKPISARQPMRRRDAGADRRTRRRRRRAPLHGRPGLRRLPRLRRRPPGRLLGSRRGAAGGPYAAFPRYPGLLERAQQPFTAAGLKVPWYSLARQPRRGSVQGNAPSSSGLFQLIATELPEDLPLARLRPARRSSGRSGSQVFSEIGNPAFVGGLLAGAGRTPPDPDRAFVSKPLDKRLQGTADRRHGFGFTDRAELRASRGTALYYSWAPRRGLRLVALDTVAEGGGAEGNLDDPQYRWLARTLRTAARRDELVIVYAHHTLATLTNRTPDEKAGCSDPEGAGCDGDPRRSTLLHLGLSGKQNPARPAAEPAARDRVRQRPHPPQRRARLRDAAGTASGRSTPRPTSTSRSSRASWS